MLKKLVKIFPKSLRDHVRTLLFGKTVDEVEVLRAFLKKYKLPTKVMVDVGAHYGDTSIPFAKEGWRVFSFEPDPVNRGFLVENVAKSNTNTITIIPKAASNVPGKLPFYRSKVSSGISGLLDFHDTHELVEEVEVVTLNNFLEKEQVQQIDFLKIDTEGYDLRVLQGIDLQRFTPQAIICEYEDRKTEKLGYTIKDTLDYFHSNGYKTILSEWYPIVEYGKRHKWKQYTSDLTAIDQKASWGNVIAVRPEYFEALNKTLNKN